MHLYVMFTHRPPVLFVFVVWLCHTLKFDVHCSCQLPSEGKGGRGKGGGGQPNT